MRYQTQETFELTIPQIPNLRATPCRRVPPSRLPWLRATRRAWPRSAEEKDLSDPPTHRARISINIEHSRACVYSRPTRGRMRWTSVREREIEIVPALIKAAWISWLMQIRGILPREHTHIRMYSFASHLALYILYICIYISLLVSHRNASVTRETENYVSERD